MSSCPSHNPAFTQENDEATFPHHEPAPFEFSGILGPPPGGKSLMEYIDEIDREPMVRQLYQYWPDNDKNGHPGIEDDHKIPDHEEGR